MIKLNDSSIYVGYIKQLLKDFNLPQFSIFDDKRIYKNGEHYLKNNAIYVVKDGKEQFVSNYVYNNAIRGLTNNYAIDSTIYDFKTHYYLGNYLRFIRDFHGIDLMGMYNCCAYESPRNFSLKEGDIEFTTYNQLYTLIMVPVKWGRKYTIAIDSHENIEMVCIHYENNRQIDKSFIEDTYFNVSSSRFNHPFVYDKLVKDSYEDNKEQTLKLFIKIPTMCTSSIVVLEGDYVDCSNSNFYLDNNIQRVSNYAIGMDENLNPLKNLNFNKNKNQLLALNTQTKLLLSNRLVEYLSLSAITPMTDVNNNIKRVQRTLSSKLGYTTNYLGIWDDAIRETICEYLWSSGLINSKDDLLSYFDKDVEYSLGGLLRKSNDSRVFTNNSIGGK